MANLTDELALLERVFLRVGSADTDEQLQCAVSKFLPPVLLKLSSEQEAVRKKVMELLIHINKRIKSRPLVQLPVDALLLQYQDPAASSFVTNFTIIYIKLGYPRLPIAKQAELMSSLLNCLNDKPPSHQDSLLLMLMPVLGHITFPEKKALFGFSERPHMSKLLRDFMLDMLLLPYSAGAQEDRVVPPGMSEYALKRVTAASTYKAEELEEIKLGIVKFLASGFMEDCDILSHLVVAAADPRFSVANAAEKELKKTVGLLDWRNVNISAPLYSLFLGTKLSSTNTIKQEHRRMPASTSMRLKILPYLSMSRGPALMFPACIQVFFDALFGSNTNPKLRNLGLQFAMIIISSANLQYLTPVGGVLLSGLLKLISDDDVSLRKLAYIAIGKLGCRLPHLVNKDLALLQSLFDALTQGDQDVRMSVREALVNMADAFRAGANGENDIVMQALLTSQVESDEPMARVVAIRFAATVFPQNHAPSRYILLLACGDGKDDTSPEALKALYGAYYQESISSNDKESEKKEDEIERPQLPEFCDIARYIIDKAVVRMQNAATRHTFGNHVLPFSPSTFLEILNYLHLCLAQSAGVVLKTREVMQHPSGSTPLIGRYLRSLQGSEIVPQYLELVQQLLTASASIVPLTCLLELVGTLPDVLASRFTEKLTWLKGLLFSAKEEIRETCAALYGVIIAHGLDGAPFDEATQDLVSKLEGKSHLEAQHGCLLAIAHSLERKITLIKGSEEQLTRFLTGPVYKSGISIIVNHLTHERPLLNSAACTAVAELARCAPLQLSDPEKLSLVKTLLGIINNVKMSSRVRERAAKACGCLCIGEDFPYSRNIMQDFLDVAKESRDVEVHFTIGEAFVSCVQGTLSPHGRDAWTTLESEYHPQCPSQVMETKNKDLHWLLLELVKLARLPHPNSKQASSIWLLALLKHCCDRLPVQQNLDNIQKTFMDLLSENNDLIQDVASKGLGLVYESGDEDCRNRLVGELLDTLSTGRRSVAQVTEDTKVFEDESLGKSPTGGSLSTYKELCSLASDLNKPDLIYKFMQLANHNTVWNSKKGAAFGFSTIAALAGEQLSQHLSKIVPRLYRYQFDPTPKIQIPMSRIWRALVKETQKTIDIYHKEILNDLVTNLTAPEWRVRMSCCVALVDFLQRGGSRNLYDCVDSLPDLWTSLLRVMDDVHEGTRQAAGNATKVLSKHCVRCCDESNRKASVEILQKILPVLLNVGICNSVPEVRAVCLHCLSELVGSAGHMLKEHLPILIPALLEATGELEIRGLSELSVRFGAERQTQEVIDTVRASAAKSQFTTETVTKCLRYVDADILNELIPKVVDLLSAKSQLGTRVASAHFVVLLTHHLKADLQPFTGKLLAALVNGLTDRNAVIRRNYASTIGQLASTAKESSLQRLFLKLKTWYFEKEDESVHSACGYTLRAIAQHNQDEVLKKHSKIVIPLVFLAMHASKAQEDNTVGVWEDVWHEVVPATEAGIRQHLTEICEILESTLSLSSWTMKAQAANSINTVATKVGSSMTAEQRNSLVNILVTGLNGRTWTGKENLLKALATICSSCKDDLRTAECLPLVNIVVEAMLRECRKDQLAYKHEALKALGNTLLALDVDRFSEVYLIVEDLLSKAADKSDSGDEDMKQEHYAALTETAYETLGKAWPSNTLTQELYREKLLEQCVSCLANSTRTVQVAIMAALRCYVERLSLLQRINELTTQEKEAVSRIMIKLYPALQFALGIPKHSQLKVEALKIILSLAKKLKDAEMTEEMNNLSVTFGPFLEEASKDYTPEIKSRVVSIKEILKL